jgi:toxin CcdB
MAQFDVFENPNVAQREAFPYLVSMQSEQLDHLATRFMMPLQRLSAAPRSAPRRLSQTVVVGDEAVYLAAHLCAPFPARVLRKPVASLAREAAVFIDALDAIVAGV